MMPPATTSLAYLASRIRNIERDVRKGDRGSAMRELIILKRDLSRGRLPAHYLELIEFANDIISSRGGILK